MGDLRVTELGICDEQGCVSRGHSWALMSVKINLWWESSWSLGEERSLRRPRVKIMMV